MMRGQNCFMLCTKDTGCTWQSDSILLRRCGLIIRTCV